MFAAIQKDGVSAAIVNTEYAGKAALMTRTASGGQSIYLEEERSICARFVNKKCKDIQLLADKLPMDPSNEDLFTVMSDGMVLIHLLNMIEADTIDMRVVCTKPNPNIYQIRENLNKALGGCKGHIKTVGINVSSFLEKSPKYILAVLVQINRILALQSFTLKDCAELIALQFEDEDDADFAKLTPEQLLVRWVNYHLKKAGQPMEPINNLGKDIKDSKAMLYVLNQLDK
jgi:hypothetical protein